MRRGRGRPVADWLRLAREEVWGATPERSPWPDWRALAARHALPLALYAALAIVVTYPLILHFGTRLPSNGGDALQNYWNYWWIGEALRAGQNPYRTPLLYAPYGAPLYLHTLNPFNGLVTLPVQFAFGLVPAYNTVVLLSLTLAAYFAYLLVGRISGSRAAGLVGGVIYAFGAYHLAHLLEHMNLLASEWLPAYLLCLILALETRGRRRTLLIAAATGALVLAMLCDWQYVALAIVATGWLAGYEAIRRRAFGPLVVAGAIGLLWAALASPVLLPTLAQSRRGIDSLAETSTVGEIARGATLLPDAGAAIRLAADPISFVVPAPRQRWWGAVAERLGGRALAPPSERSLFLGYLPLALAGIGLWRGRRRALAWAGLALVAFALALGPTLHFLGQPVTIGGRGVPLPFRLLQALPGIGLMRVPARSGLLVTLGVAVLAGIGLAGAWRAKRGAATRGGRAVALAALVAALVAEQITAPIALETPVAPAFYEELGRSPEPGAVMEWPFCKQCAATNYYQTVHGHPVVGGYISRRLAYPLRNLPPYVELPAASADIFGHPGVEAVGRWAVRHAGVRWIVVDRAAPQFDERTTGIMLGRFAEPTPIYDDGRLAAYRPLAPGEPFGYLQPGDGWYAPEPWVADRGKMRWFAERAEVGAWNFTAESRDYALRFSAWSHATPRRLEVWFDGQRLGEWIVGDLRSFDLPLTLTPGPHRVELRSLDPPTSPSSLGGGSSDARLLGIGVAEMALTGR